MPGLPISTDTGTVWLGFSSRFRVGKIFQPEGHIPYLASFRQRHARDVWGQRQKNGKPNNVNFAFFTVSYLLHSHIPICPYEAGLVRCFTWRKPQGADSESQRVDLFHSIKYEISLPCSRERLLSQENGNPAWLQKIDTGWSKKGFPQQHPEKLRI